MVVYTNDKGQTQSPPVALAPTAHIQVKHTKTEVPTPYALIAGFEPIDTMTCQAPSKWVEGSKSRQHPALKRTRCDRPATTVMVENEPRFGPNLPVEGFIAAYSCCDWCREHILTTHPNFAKFTPIEK